MAEIDLASCACPPSGHRSQDWVCQYISRCGKVTQPQGKNVESYGVKPHLGREGQLSE